MSLLTPPHTSHRADKDKENKFPDPPIAGPSTRTVVWAAKDIIHSLGTPIKHVSISSKSRPSISKSILKPLPENYFLELPAVVQQRETTPEPSDPLVDLHYLGRPVDQILSNGDDSEDALANLIEAYNVLAARLRACVTESTDADASWPIFQPLRKNTQAVVDAIIRGVKCVLVDPLSHNPRTGEETMPKLPRHALPSPATSPTKKKGGLSEEQVKYARDLSTACHSVIKLLAVIFSLPAVYNIFEEKQLGDILTAVLAIPLADDLPTPNARKTCALAIWLIQVQRLPADVLKPAASRIAYALRRGLDGELGKEGKKGSANDGLKAIHDLCVYLPVIFIPAFVALLPSVLTNLLAPTLALRTQACHALGGFVIGSTAIPTSTVHTKIASIVAAFLTTASSPTKLGKSTIKPTEAAIVRTIRTTLSNVEPPHVAAGPVWGISVCASLVVLLGARLSTDSKVIRILSNLLNLGMRHGKSSVRALTCAVWRPVAWTYFQSPLPVEEDEESEVDDESYMQRKQTRLLHCKFMISVVDCQAGVSTIAALLAEDDPTEEALQLSLNVLQSMALRAGHTCQDGIEALQQMVSGVERTESWNMKLLLPSKLFSANPGLLTADFKTLSKPVREVFDQLAMVHDIRSLTREEMTKDWVLKGMMLAWRTALGCLEMEDGAELPDNLTEIWTNLLKANVSMLQETSDDDSISSFACSVSKYIVYIMEDPKLNLMPRDPTDRATSTPTETVPGSDDTIPEFKGNATCTNGELRMRVIQRMWSAMRMVFPYNTLRECAEGIVGNLMKHEGSLVCGTGTTAVVIDEDVIEQARVTWVGLCVDVLIACEVDTIKMFWGCEDDMAAAVAAGRHYSTWSHHGTSIVWKAFTDKWVETSGSWEGGIVLLGIPFTDRHTWGLTSEDYTIWEQVYQHTTSNALDLGIESSAVLDDIAAFVSSFQTPGASPASSLRLVDLLLSNLDVSDMRELPVNILELTSETMRVMYPPEPRVRHFAMWVVRSLATVIEHCPKEFSMQLLQTIQEGLSVWFSDKAGEWTETEFIYDIVTLYQHIILKVQDLAQCIETIEATGPILDSIFRYRSPAAAIESFTDFWNLVYAQMAPPEQGWTGPIRHCLGAVGVLPAEDKPEAPVHCLASAFVPEPSPRTPISTSFTTPPTAVLRRQVESPQRPRKVFSSCPIVPSTPPSPVDHRRSSSSVRRTPLSAIQLYQTPSKRRRLTINEGCGNEDKENVLLTTNIASVAERISGLSAPIPKKRCFEDVDDGKVLEGDKPVTRSAKRLKSQMKSKSKMLATSNVASPVPSIGSNESEDERSVEAELTIDVLFPSEDRIAETTTAVPKRTRGNRLRSPAMSAPTQLLANHRSNGSAEPARHLDCPAGAIPVRKVDFGKTLRKSASAPAKLLRSAGKRKRVDSDATYQPDVCDTTPLDRVQSGIRIGPPRHAKKRTLPASDSDAGCSQIMSSDDDPHYGQVTPHHLISPALRRRPGSFIAAGKFAPFIEKLVEDDIPGSDDTVCSSGSSGSDSDSPTKEFLTRQLSRTSSADSILSKRSV